MGYSIHLLDKDTKETIEISSPHDIKGSTYQVGGSTSLKINITYNYSPFFRIAFSDEKGIRSLYGKSVSMGLECLKKAFESLQGPPDSDYWNPTEGNAKKALLDLICICQLAPEDATIDGD